MEARTLKELQERMARPLNEVNLSMHLEHDCGGSGQWVVGE